MKKIKEYFCISIGVILVAIALEYFFFQNDIACGGISGLALVINKITNIDPGIIMVVCNIILFSVAFLLLGGSYGIKSIYASFLLSFILSVLEKNNLAFNIVDDLMLATICGSVILAMGSAIVFSFGASTGGTSIIASIVNKYFNLEIGKCLLISDSIVIILAIATFGIKLGLYGLVSVYLASRLIDKFIDGFNECKQVIIFTKNEDKISNYIMKDVDRGCTIFQGKGGYSREENSVIYTVVDRKQFIKLKKFIKTEEPTAFMTVNEASEVVGKGFGGIGR